MKVNPDLLRQLANDLDRQLQDPLCGTYGPLFHADPLIRKAAEALRDVAKDKYDKLSADQGPS